MHAVTVLLFSLLFALYPKADPSIRVIVIGLDGFGTEGYEQVKHPELDALFKNGVISLNTRSVMPSVTMPNWTSHLTGGGPEQHGVMDNTWEKDSHMLPPQETDPAGYYPSIFYWVKKQSSSTKTAFYYNWANLIKPFNLDYLDRSVYTEEENLRESYQEAFEFVRDNREDPTLLFLYSVHIDHAGHSYGWMSPEYVKAIGLADERIGELVKNLKDEGLYEDTYFLLITDHGGVETRHGGTSVAEMEVPWMLTGPGIEKGKLKAPNSNANTAAVIGRIFGIDGLQESAIGKVPAGIFKD